MQRHREIAAAPVRSTTATWATVRQLVVDSLSAASSISPASVTGALDALDDIGVILVGGGYLENDALVVVAAQLNLSITTVSGADALELEEDLNRVAGAATAETFTIHVPAPAPHTAAVEVACKASTHLTADAPSMSPIPNQKSTELAIDMGALRSRLGGGS